MGSASSVDTVPANFRHSRASSRYSCALLPHPRLGVRVPFRSFRLWPLARFRPRSAGRRYAGFSQKCPMRDQAALVFLLHLRVKLAGQSIEICHRRAGLLSLLKLVCRAQAQLRRVGLVFGGLGPGEKRSRSLPIITLARHSARHFPDCALADRTPGSGIGSLRYLSKIKFGGARVWAGFIGT